MMYRDIDESLQWMKDDAEKWLKSHDPLFPKVCNKKKKNEKEEVCKLEYSYFTSRKLRRIGEEKETLVKELQYD